MNLMIILISSSRDVALQIAVSCCCLQKDNRFSTYKTHDIPMQPEPELASSFDLLKQHWQSRRPAHDGIVVGR